MQRDTPKRPPEPGADPADPASLRDRDGVDGDVPDLRGGAIVQAAARPSVAATRDDALRRQLRVTLAKQASFTRGYAPLYAAVLDVVREWLERAGPSSAADAAADARASRQAGSRPQAEPPSIHGRELHEVVGRIERFFARPFHNDLDPTLRVGAVLHWYVLTGDPRAAPLRPWYPTAGGERKVDEPGFEAALGQAMVGLGDELFETAASWQVQTNETARGVVWLLPAAIVGVEAAHLVELGASAGLNLYADHRRFRLDGAAGSGGPPAADAAPPTLVLGKASTEQFVIPTRGAWPQLASPAAAKGPDVLTRVGGDLAPVDVDSADAEARLLACVWPDQLQRVLRMREALDLQQRMRGRADAARLLRMTLPDDLAEFLGAAVPRHPEAPVILYNTYVTAYLNDVDHRAVVRGVDAFARAWTLTHGLPWMWVRFEPARVGEPSPHPGWCRWRVVIWERGHRRDVELGWAHPHLGEE
jgi:hypothetical protein